MEPVQLIALYTVALSFGSVAGWFSYVHESRFLTCLSIFLIIATFMVLQMFVRGESALAHVAPDIQNAFAVGVMVAFAARILTWKHSLRPVEEEDADTVRARVLADFGMEDPRDEALKKDAVAACRARLKSDNSERPKILKFRKAD